MKKTSVKKDFWVTFITLIIGVIVGICIIKISGITITSDIQVLKFNEIFNHNTGVALII